MREDDIPDSAINEFDKSNKDATKSGEQTMMKYYSDELSGAEVDKDVVVIDDRRTCCIPFRFVVLFVGMTCLVALQANITVIKLAFVCMSEDPSGMHDAGNGTFANRFVYTPTEKSFIIGAVAVGTFIGSIVFNWLHAKYGARWPFFAAVLISAASTVANPIMAEQSIVMLVAVRFVQGFAYAADFAAVGVIWVRWAPLKETATFIGILMSFGAIAFIFTNPIVGVFCTSAWGWRAAFYVFGTVTALLFLIFLIVYRDDPQKHPAVSPRELAVIEKDKTAEHQLRDGFVPYKQGTKPNENYDTAAFGASKAEEICMDRTVLVVWLNSMIEINAGLLLLTYAPIYFTKVLGFDIRETSLYASLGGIFHAAIKISVGYLSDSMGCFSERAKLIFFNTIATGFTGICCAGIGFAPTRELGVFMLTFTTSIMASNAGGFFKCAALVSRQYAHFVLATMQMMKCAAYVISPAMVSILTKSDGDATGWRHVFILNCILMLIANFLFYPVATDMPAEFTKITKETRRLEIEERKRQKGAGDKKHAEIA